MEWLILGLFAGALLLCITLQVSLFYALLFGLGLFLLYGKSRGFSWKSLFRLTLDGVKTVKNIMPTFLLIGMLTASWRASGTVPAIVSYASVLIRPSIFLLMAFLLNCGVSFLTGTSFGTAATMGVICTAMAAAMGISPYLAGGAVLSGVYFGDRCSPASTTALLISEITGTDLFDNLKRMMRSARTPFLLVCLIYGVLGLFLRNMQGGMDLRALFTVEFRLHWLALVPAVMILLLSLLRVKVKLVMLASILAAVPLCLFLQHMTMAEVVKTLIFGYEASSPELAAMINGGGLLSMVSVVGMMCLTSSFSKLLQETGLLKKATNLVERVAEKTTGFAAILMTAVLTAMISCSQMLAILLTEQLCRGLAEDQAQFANDLEDTTVIVAPWFPWSMAVAVPLATLGVPDGALLCACYLYLLPLWRLAKSFYLKNKNH